MYTKALSAGGHVMASNADMFTDDIYHNSQNDTHVVSAYVISNWSNGQTKRYILENDGSVSDPISRSGIGTWDDSVSPTETDWLSISDLVGIESANDIDVRIVYDPLVTGTLSLGGYIIDTTTGKMCVKFANEIDSDLLSTAKIGIDITLLRNEVSEL